MRITCGVCVGLVMRITRACSVCVEGWLREVTPLCVQILCGSSCCVMMIVCYVMGVGKVHRVCVHGWREVTPLDDILCGGGGGVVVLCAWRVRVSTTCCVCVYGGWREVTPLGVHILCGGGGGVVVSV